MLPIASIIDPGYKIALFFHLIAVVVALGPTFGYGVLFSVLGQYPRSAPALITGMQRIDRYLVNPGLVILLIAGMVLLSTSDGAWDGGDFFVVWGFIAIIALFGVQHGFFAPQARKAKELAERDLKAGDTLSPEFEALGQRIGQIGMLTGILVAVTVFFMAYKPFM